MAEKVITLKPGRELDIEVAKVLGWTNIHPQAYTSYGRDACGTTPNGKGGWYDSGRTYIPHYSSRWTDASGAWEWLEKNHPWGETARVLLGRAVDESPAIFLDDDHGGLLVKAKGESYPHVICLVVLEAVEGG